jgi:Fe(3+) dicitrate transport protein
MLRFTLILIILYSSTLESQNQPKIEKDSIISLDEVIIKSNTILGNKFVAKNRTGAAYYFSKRNWHNLIMQT